MKCTYCDKTSGTFPINATFEGGVIAVCPKCIKEWFDCMEKFKDLEIKVKHISDNVKIG